jgi:cation diffusion facilitator CzcD-associated flavoprotein CzcO
MRFWSGIADAGGERHLKSFCFGTNISTPKRGFSFSDYNAPRGLETFEPCSIENFTAYGRWFQENVVPWVEPLEVINVVAQVGGFAITLADGKKCIASRVVIATGLTYFDDVPQPLAALLPTGLVTHTSQLKNFATFKRASVAVIGAGQSALEATALLHEAGAWPELIVRESKVLWQTRTLKERSLRRRLRSPLSGLGSGPLAWALTHFPGAVHHAPEKWRTRFVRSHLPAEGAWWLRDRVENRVPIHLETSVKDAITKSGRIELRLCDARTGSERPLAVDYVVAGTGYHIDVQRIEFLDLELRRTIECIERAPKLNDTFQTSVPGLYFVGPASSMSFGPLFRFVVGAEYTSRIVSKHLSAQMHFAK